jgi:hypothetical protein
MGVQKGIIGLSEFGKVPDPEQPPQPPRIFPLKGFDGPMLPPSETPATALLPLPATRAFCCLDPDFPKSLDKRQPGRLMLVRSPSRTTVNSTAPAAPDRTPASAAISATLAPPASTTTSPA